MSCHSPMMERDRNTEVISIESGSHERSEVESGAGRKRKHSSSPLVSIIMPVHNASEYLDDAFVSITEQTYRPLEVVCFDDCSDDESLAIMQCWKAKLEQHNVSMLVLSSLRSEASGPGYARNQSIQSSSGEYICHLDADDFMHSDRVQQQLNLICDSEHNSQQVLVGSNFDRTPSGSTPFYTTWLNNLNEKEMMLQQYRECTIICPTWFYHKCVYTKVKECNGIGFVEKDCSLKRVPEDLIFFLDHLSLGGELAKVPKPLVTYRYVQSSWSIGTKSVDLQRVRAKYIEKRVLSKWPTFSIYGGGFDAKKFANMLSVDAANKIRMFGDIAPKRIGTKYFHQGIRKHIPIVHWKDLEKPLVICVAAKRAGEELEKNIQSLNLTEGVDFFRFN